MVQNKIGYENEEENFYTDVFNGDLIQKLLDGNLIGYQEAMETRGTFYY